MKAYQKLLATAASMALCLPGMPMPSFFKPVKVKKQKVKVCLHCKQEHTTGKPFCSAKCCREYQPI